MLPSKKRTFFATLALVLVVGVLVAVPLGAQESLPASSLPAQSMRPYRFVFYAYALAWALVLGWVVSIARKASEVARRLEE